MPHIVWTDVALEDLERLHDFLASKESSAAGRAVLAIYTGMLPLQDHPEAGTQVKNMMPGFREWFIPFGRSGYRALYRVQGDDIFILAVKHGREETYSYRF